MFFANDVHAQVVKGRYRKPARGLAFNKLVYALFHFARGFVGKGYSSDIARAHAAFFNEIGNFAGNYTGFARTCASQH